MKPRAGEDVMGKRSLRVRRRAVDGGRPRTVFLGVLFFSLWATPGFFYIDPGTGSALVLIVTTVVASAYFGARGRYYTLLELLFRTKHRHQKCNVAVHSEDPRYEITFLPVLRELARRGTEITYFTMYERNASWEALPLGVAHQVIPSGMAGYAYLNHLEARILVTTTPQLDVMTFQRSKRVQHYCHIPHALGESIYVRPFAYDFFDSVLCCGPILEANIRRMEGIRNLPPKQLFRTGIPHYDDLIRSAEEGKGRSGSRTVLIAPSWGPLSLFQAFGTDFVRGFAQRYDVVVRPHPQMKVSQPEVYREVLELDGVTVDTHTTPVEAMARADVLVSDISGIMHEFAFIHGKPVIIIDHDTGIGGLEGHLLGGESTLKELCRDFIVPLPPSEIGNLPDRIEAILETPLSGRIAEVRDEVIFNFGRAGPVAANQIQEILEGL